ncbi:putative LPS assembly protein LptD [Salinimicrobium sp. HB62]|uniref:putative LPS assembly protein LptD n=1 Tax=Salinimicrobium sp. HB62 TaxID=3077781 RepID=UPI002D77CFC9|nr:putative LPS assembly protein LptD [Salinimicrobium sp. HB62]
MLSLASKSTAQEIRTNEGIRIPAEREPVQPIRDSLRIEAPVPVISLTPTTRDTVRPKNEPLTDRVVYTAQDYMRLSPRENRLYLYDNAEITYGDINITAGKIILDNERNEVYAYGIVDSAGVYTQKPVFTQAESVVRPDSIRFNFDTERALVFNSRTDQGEFKVLGQITKRENDSVYYMKNVRFTTSPNEENPDYYFYARRIKFVPDKKIVSGLVNMYIADVPTPLGLPFGYFPMTDEQTSGFIIPSFGDDNNRGFFLQNGGYYFAISDYVDLTVLGDYYTNGSYAMRMESSYALRYRFRGNLSFRFEKLINSEPGFPDFSESTIYNLRWNHSQDSKANPTSRFSAAVNLGSSDYYQASTNQMNTGNRLTNTLSSSVSYSKTFNIQPQINLSIAATHSQNTNTEQINMTLPTVQASMARVYPFEPKVGAKKGIIENINFQYNFRGENRFQTTDSLFFKPEMFKNAILGAQHSIPLTTNFKLFNYLSVSAGTNYTENWVFRTFERSYDEEARVEVIDTVSGFDSFRTYNFNTSIGTTIYGTKNFSGDGKYQAIRHVLRPSISYNINPGFGYYYDNYIIPETDGREERVVEYSRFQGTLYGPPGKVFSSSIGLSLSNTFEAKVKDSVDAEPRKVKLLNNFNVSTSYNLAGDSLRLSPISVRGNIPIIQNKLDINFGTNLDIYALNNENRRIDKLNIENGGSLFRLTNANMSFGYSFSSDQFSGGKENVNRLENQTFRNGGRPDDLFGKDMDIDGTFYDEKETNPAEEEESENSWYNFDIPWDLRLAYTLNYANNARQSQITSHSLMFSGDVELSPKWTVGASSGYDFVNTGFTHTQLRFARDLESWRMTFSWTPFGVYKQWNFFIGIKSSLLRDIKYEKRRERDRRL